MYANTGLWTCCACARSQSCACELPVRACMCADRVRHHVHDLCTLGKYFPSVVLSYLILH